MNEFNIFDKGSSELKTKYVIACTMLVVGILMRLSIKTSISYVFIVAGIVLIYAASAKSRNRDKELRKIVYMDLFEAEVSKAKKYLGMGLMLTESYAVVVRPALKIYTFTDMDKFAVDYLASEGKHDYFDLNGAMTQGMYENAMRHIKVFTGIE